MHTDLKELVKTSKTLKLLYVEDDEEARSATLKLLQNFFIDIITAIDGQEALNYIKNNKFDLILSDINMPNINGLDMIHQIRINGNQTPAILLSAHNESAYFTEAIKLGIEYFILKPIQRGKFIDAINKVVNIINLKEENEHYKNFLEDEIQTRTKELKYKLHFDNNTKLLNRFSFFEDIQKIEQPLLFLLDINKFKMINEVYGTHIGNLVLRKFANFLVDICKGKAYEVYRISGDEFAILGEFNISNENHYRECLISFFRKLNNFIVKSYNDTISIEVCIGISTTINDTFETAEVALDYAKENRINYTIYSEKINKKNKSAEILKTKNMIRLALEEKRIVPVYQAIVDKNKTIVKHEILMRIQKENSTELISPYFFLDVAVKTSLYDQLSNIIIFEALKLLQTSTYTLNIKNTYLIKKIDAFFNQYPHIGKRAVFEITEDEGIDDYEDVKNFIKHFQKFGVKVAIDDFGTGFSNFENILEIEPYYLKIDGSLIKNIDKDTRSFTLVQAIVKFSHKLGIKIIAEYVHSEQIFNMLKALEVDEYQGYYFSEPDINISD